MYFECDLTIFQFHYAKQLYFENLNVYSLVSMTQLLRQRGNTHIGKAKVKTTPFISFKYTKSDFGGK
jgi:hypothetical protein